MAKPQLTLVENTGSWHGRVVAQTHEVPSRHTVQSLPLADQLDLFDAPAPPDLRVFVVAMDTVHGRTLQKAVLSHKPRSVIDLRYAARFDQYGSDRDTLFAYFTSVGSYYALDSMPWHDLSVRDFMTEGGVRVPRAHHELLELDKGTVMFFVPKPQHANMLIAYLNRMLTAKAKTSWRMEQIG
ncbi:hypothetical protein [Agrobacterium fabrum]|uniref:hypothetical protein n=1 Tax=Agrobacterium fabrum TaxID=1176649 RepID=UPI00215794E3|nr:hypothetical protein [Agrobacterium fabrum]MCR6727129.1 hypothetical protein [Agrobacterium fabrum]